MQGNFQTSLHSHMAYPLIIYCHSVQSQSVNCDILWCLCSLNPDHWWTQAGLCTRLYACGLLCLTMALPAHSTLSKTTSSCIKSKSQFQCELLVWMELNKLNWFHFFFLSTFTVPLNTSQINMFTCSFEQQP